MIQSWLAGKASGLIIFCVALAAVPLAIIAGVQTVRLDGISLFGWHLVDGAIHARDLAESERDRALKDLGTARANQATLRAGLDEANASIASLKRQSEIDTAAADARLRLEVGKRSAVEKALAKIREAHIDTSSPGSAAISLDQLMKEGVR